MARKTKSQRLKVYMTQIGFHNWLVAAPSQKAALAAWDVKENLFAIGSARAVTDKDGIELAMKTPGVPVPVDAGHDLSKASRVVRLDDHRRRKAPRHLERTPTPKPPKHRKTDRTKLNRAEEALEDFERRAVRERAALLRARKALDLKAEELEEELDAEQERLEKALDEARDEYEAESKANRR